MPGIIYPKKLDVPSTLGNIFDLQEFFTSGKQSASIARIEMKKCKELQFN